MSKSRVVAKKVLSVEQSEGVGARVRRSVGRPEVVIATAIFSCNFSFDYTALSI